MSTPTSCTRCRKQKKRCILLPDGSSCQRCFDSAQESCDVNPTVQILACSRCRKQHKKCIPGPSACERCIALSCESECDIYPISSPAIVPTPTNIDQSKTYEPEAIFLNPLLESYMSSFEAPIDAIADEIWELEDPDLMPTMDDWLLMFNRLTNFGTDWPLHGHFDADSFLRNFMRVSPALRLILCAGAAARYIENPAVKFNYYNRARKAVLHALERPPSLETVIACTGVVSFAYAFSQLEVGNQFLLWSIKMCVELRLNTDPDESPWLYALNLSPRQKEERRRVCWSVVVRYAWNMALLNDEMSFDIDCSNLKAPSAVYDDQPIFVSCAMMKTECETLQAIAKIKRHFMVPPRSIHELFYSKKYADFYLCYTAILSNVPRHLLLESSLVESISPTEEIEFIAKVKASEDFIVHLNMNINGAKSILHRPRMMVSGLASFAPNRLSSEQRVLMADSITTCVTCALRNIELFNFGTRQSRQGPFGFDSGADSLFEAIIVIWFIYCRMNPEWWNYLSYRVVDFKVLRINLTQVVEFLFGLERLEVGSLSSASPRLQCTWAMLVEIDQVTLLGLPTVPINNMDLNVTGLELGLKIMSLGKDSNFKEDDAVITEPLAFMGLLGAQVSDGIRWKGRSEESWRLFWKLNG